MFIESVGVFRIKRCLANGSKHRWWISPDAIRSRAMIGQQSARWCSSCCWLLCCGDQYEMCSAQSLIIINNPANTVKNKSKLTAINLKAERRWLMCWEVWGNDDMGLCWLWFGRTAPSWLYINIVWICGFWRVNSTILNNEIVRSPLWLVVGLVDEMGAGWKFVTNDKEWTDDRSTPHHEGSC